MSNPYQPGPIAGGVERLVGALMGGDEAEAAARQSATMKLLQQQSAEATIDKKMTDALLARDKRLAQQEYEANLSASGFDPVVAKTLSGLLVGGHGAHIDNVQKYGIRDRLPELYEADGFTPANALAASFNPKPIANTKIEGGHIIDALYGADPVIKQTEKEAAATQTQHARTQTANAQTANANARTDQVRDKTANPERYRSAGGGGGRPKKADLVGHPGSGLLPDKQDMLDFATDPKGLKDSFIEAFGYDAYLSALQSVPSLKPHVFRKKPTANDTAALRDRKIAPEDFIKQFGQAAYDAAAGSFKAAKQKKKDAK